MLSQIPFNSGFDLPFEVQLWKFILSQPYAGWIRMKRCTPTYFPSPKDNVFCTVTENKFNVWNYSFSGPNGIYSFSKDNRRIKCYIYSKLTIEAINSHSSVFILNFEYIWYVAVVSILQIFWTCKYWTDYFVSLI